MATGTPILVYAPQATALSSYAKRSKAFAVANSKTELRKELNKLINKNKYRELLGVKAKKIALNEHSDIIVQNKFRQAISGNN